MRSLSCDSCSSEMRPEMTVFVIFIAISYLLGTHGLANPSRKTWWAKRISSSDIYTCGRPTERQVKYASENGFKTLISLHTYDSDNGDVSAKGGIYLPSTAKTKYIAEQLAGMDFQVVLPSGVRDWMSLDIIKKVYDIVRNSTKPVLFYSGSSYEATFLTLAHFLNVTRYNDNQPGEPNLTDDELFSIGAQLGFNFAYNATLRSLVAEIAGSSELAERHEANEIVKNWQNKYWKMKPTHMNFFIAGQIQSNELRAIESTGIKTIINSRTGTTEPPNNVKSQEEVNLLNIKARTGTYKDSGRQSVLQLEANRIDPNKSDIYISDTATFNYEMNNTLEFGDEIGYNETIERLAIRSIMPNVNYIHLPISTRGKYNYGLEMWEEHRDAVIAATRNGPVLIHCRTGLRSSVLALLTEAYLYCYNSTWAISKARRMGYNFEVKKLAITLLQDVLDERPGCVVDTYHVTVKPLSSVSSVIQDGVRLSLVNLLIIIILLH